MIHEYEHWNVGSYKFFPVVPYALKQSDALPAKSPTTSIPGMIVHGGTIGASCILTFFIVSAARMLGHWGWIFVAVAQALPGTCAVSPYLRVNALGCVSVGPSLLINQLVTCARLLASVSFGLIAAASDHHKSSVSIHRRPSIAFILRVASAEFRYIDLASHTP